MKITVFTPTYNRRDYLCKLYKSLKNQNYKELVWIIVDDGSTDDTFKYVEKWKKESLFEIDYVYQKNSGKQAAYNVGLSRANGELFICIDSDDYYADGAFYYIKEQWDKIKDDYTFAGLGFLSSYQNNKIIGDKFPLDVIDTDSVTLHTKYKVFGDKGLVFRTSIIKQYPFPIIEGEKFITESLIYNRIALKYRFRYINKVIEIKEYVGDGLTAKYERLLADNPKGNLLYYKEYMDNNSAIRYRIGAAISYLCWSWYYGKNIAHILKDSNKILMILLAYPIAFVRYKSWLKDKKINIES